MAEETTSFVKEKLPSEAVFLARQHVRFILVTIFSVWDNVLVCYLRQNLRQQDFLSPKYWPIFLLFEGEKVWVDRPHHGYPTPAEILEIDETAGSVIVQPIFEKAVRKFLLLLV